MNGSFNERGLDAPIPSQAYGQEEGPYSSAGSPQNMGFVGPASPEQQIHPAIQTEGNILAVAHMLGMDPKELHSAFHSPQELSAMQSGMAKEAMVRNPYVGQKNPTDNQAKAFQTGVAPTLRQGGFFSNALATLKEGQLADKADAFEKSRQTNEQGFEAKREGMLGVKQAAFEKASREAGAFQQIEQDRRNQQEQDNFNAQMASVNQRELASSATIEQRDRALQAKGRGRGRGGSGSASNDAKLLFRSVKDAEDAVRLAIAKGETPEMQKYYHDKYQAAVSEYNQFTGGARQESAPLTNRPTGGMATWGTGTKNDPPARPTTLADSYPAILREGGDRPSSGNLPNYLRSDSEYNKLSPTIKKFYSRYKGGKGWLRNK